MHTTELNKGRGGALARLGLRLNIPLCVRARKEKKKKLIKPDTPLQCVKLKTKVPS